MKKILLLSMLFAGALYVVPARAQVSVHVNIGSQPSWGPVGYDYVDYYYLPDIEAYYNVPSRTFVYCDGGRWINSGVLPPRYRGYDLYSGYKVVVNEPNPWLRHTFYTHRYAPYGRYQSQVVIRDSRDPRYFRGDGRGDYGRGDYGRGDYGRGDHGRGDYGRDDHGRDDHGRGGYGRGDYGRRDDRGNGRFDRDGYDRRNGHGDWRGGY